VSETAHMLGAAGGPGCSAPASHSSGVPHQDRDLPRCPARRACRPRPRSARRSIGTDTNRLPCRRVRAGAVLAPVIAASLLLRTGMSARAVLDGLVQQFVMVTTRTITTSPFYAASMGTDDPAANLLRMLAWRGGYALVFAPALAASLAIKATAPYRRVAAAGVFALTAIALSLTVRGALWSDAFRPLPVILLMAAALVVAPGQQPVERSGAIRTDRVRGPIVAEALHWIEQSTDPHHSLAVVPESVTVNFLAKRITRHPTIIPCRSSCSHSAKRGSCMPSKRHRPILCYSWTGMFPSTASENSGRTTVRPSVIGFARTMRVATFGDAPSAAAPRFGIELLRCEGPTRFEHR